MKKLDLHGMRHAEARVAVTQFVEDNWNSGIEAQIVTGNSTKMRGVVLGVLDEYKLTYQISEMFGIYGHITTWFE
jgi:hypothetical protein